jgi:hypothetical protein
MTFGKRLTADLEVVHSCDPALEFVDQTVMSSYLLSRDISVLPKSAVDAATVFTVRPLEVKYEGLINSIHEPQAMRSVFRSHVCAVRGPMASWLTLENHGGNRRLTEQASEEVSLDVVGEIVTVIVQSASKRGDAAPFSPPDSWRQNRLLTARARALAALLPTEPSAHTVEDATGGKTS